MLLIPRSALGALRQSCTLVCGSSSASALCSGLASPRLYWTKPMHPPSVGTPPSSGAHKIVTPRQPLQQNVSMAQHDRSDKRRCGKQPKPNARARKSCVKPPSRSARRPHSTVSSLQAGPPQRSLPQSATSWRLCRPCCTPLRRDMPLRQDHAPRMPSPATRHMTATWCVSSADGMV